MLTQHTFKPLAIATALVMAAAMPGHAGVSISVPLEGPEGSVQSSRYACADGKPFTVQYVNVGENRLALIPIDGQELVFVNVISGSGARYVSGTLEWWSKGSTATLSDSMKDDGAGQSCSAPS